MATITAHQIALWIHYFISGGFLINALWLLIRVARGTYLKLPYNQLDKTLAYLFIVNLYLQLLFGLILSTNLSIFGYDYQSASGTVASVSKRLWPIEHIVLMLFALFIANLGLIFSNKSTLAHEKHQKIFIYYSIAILLIATSLASIYLF
ncbi:MAG TPA: hypothetical protein DCG69_02660 [Bacteroidales bacterium]|nr:hypothetical protein [Bacteroidales bacterium]